MSDTNKGCTGYMAPVLEPSGGDAARDRHESCLIWIGRRRAGLAGPYIPSGNACPGSKREPGFSISPGKGKLSTRWKASWQIMDTTVVGHDDPTGVRWEPEHGRTP